MTKLLSTLAILAAASSTLATAVIWILLTEPTTIANAFGQGSLRILVAAIVGNN